MNTQADHLEPRTFRRPRDYAAAIVEEAGNVSRQHEIFAACPLEWRAQVRDLAKRALAQAEKVLEHKRLMRRAAENDPAPLVPTRRISQLKKSSPEVGRKRLDDSQTTIIRN